VTAAPTIDGVDAIVVAAGSSSRMGGFDKLDATIAGRPILLRAIDAMAGSDLVERIVVVVSADRLEERRATLASVATAVVAGGPRRHESVAAGLTALSSLGGQSASADDDRIVLVHDAARPIVTPALVERVTVAARDYGAAVPCMPIVETVKRIDDSVIVETVERAGLATVQTPQAVRRGLLRQAFARFPPAGPQTWTDEAALLEACGTTVRVVPGEPENRKVTVAADLALVAASLGPPARRVGIGRDNHPFGPGEPLVLCGVEIPGAPRLHGHSDGDVALHAVADAMLGAAGLGDIGRQFPADARTPIGVASTSLLSAVVGLVAAAGWRPATVDLTVVGARPRLAGYLDRMRDGLAARLAVDPDAVAVKAATGNLSGDEGAGRAISALAIVALDPR
jgi:2-C-methyl-D-erythritol 4-phosphate cytidylyltransferase/2-C-methyl-D-erythritol 2,4-cyclodiphosphate synthase